VVHIPAYYIPAYGYEVGLYATFYERIIDLRTSKSDSRQNSRVGATQQDIRNPKRKSKKILEKTGKEKSTVPESKIPTQKSPTLHR
jgi:hypothetical protein